MEKKLISTYKHGNSFEIEEIVKEYSNYVYKIVKNMAGNLSNEDMEEVCSDVFLVVWNNKEKMLPEKPIEPYITGITKNIVRNKFRNVRLDYDIEECEENIKDEVDIQQLMEQKDKNKIIKKTLDTIKEEDKEIFILFYYYSKSINEIAEKMQITESNVKTKLHRIRKKLKKDLIEGGYSYGK